MILLEQFLWHLMKVSGQCHKKDQGEKLYCKNRSLRKISLKKVFETYTQCDGQKINTDRWTA